MKSSNESDETEKMNSPGGQFPVLVVSVPRSSSTALADLFKSASGVNVAVEPEPNFNAECGLERLGAGGANVREMIEGCLSNRMAMGGNEGRYIEKSVSLGPFLSDLRETLGEVNVVFLHRDGRDVVTSCINWHRAKFGNFYREAGFDPKGSEEMRLFISGLKIENDTNDFSRQRLEGWIDNLLVEGTEGRFRSLAAMWAGGNREYRESLCNYGKDKVFGFSATASDGRLLEALGNFSGCEFSEQAGEKFLRGGGNSVADRGFSDRFDPFPQWVDWSSRARDIFEDEAASEMEALGYWDSGEKERCRWKPKGYGEFWREKAADVDWFEWMYESRAYAHNDLESFVEARRRDGDRFATVAEVGPGIGVGYRDFFRDSGYHGFEVTGSCVDWFNREHGNERHIFYERDLLDQSEQGKDREYDLVFSQGTVDNTYDVDRYLLAMCSMSRKWVYATCYRGWFPYLDEHTYHYSVEQGCFYNDISPDRVMRILVGAGYSREQVWIEPLPTGRGDIGFETRIVVDVS